MPIRRSACFLVLSVACAYSQSATPTCGLAHPAQCLKDVVRDQKGVWTSPFRVQRSDAAWLIPLAGATAIAFRYDHQAENALGVNPKLANRSNKIANFGSPYATVGGAAGFYITGLAFHNEHLSETGRLGMEAIVDSEIVVEALKLAINRQRMSDGGSGFWPQGFKSIDYNSSFPSGHAAASWSIARVVASEYPKNRPLKIAAYAFATTISVCRVTGRAHFPSDVVVGSAFGYLIGGYVVRHHAAERADDSN